MKISPRFGTPARADPRATSLRLGFEAGDFVVGEGTVQLAPRGPTSQPIEDHAGVRRWSEERSPLPARPPFAPAPRSHSSPGAQPLSEAAHGCSCGRESSWSQHSPWGESTLLSTRVGRTHTRVKGWAGPVSPPGGDLPAPTVILREPLRPGVMAARLALDEVVGVRVPGAQLSLMRFPGSTHLRRSAVRAVRCPASWPAAAAAGATPQMRRQAKKPEEPAELTQSRVHRPAATGSAARSTRRSARSRRKRSRSRLERAGGPGRRASTPAMIERLTKLGTPAGNGRLRRILRSGRTCSARSRTKSKRQPKEEDLAALERRRTKRFRRRNSFESTAAIYGFSKSQRRTERADPVYRHRGAGDRRTGAGRRRGGTRSRAGNRRSGAGS